MTDGREERKTKSNFHLIFLCALPSTPQYIQFLLILKNVVDDKRWNKKMPSEEKKCLENPLIMKCEAKQKHITRGGRGERRANCNNCQEIIVKFISIYTVFKWETRSLTEERRHISPLLTVKEEKKFHMSKYFPDEHFIMPTEGMSFQFFSPLSWHQPQIYEIPDRISLWVLVVESVRALSSQILISLEVDANTKTREPFKVHVDINMLHQNRLINFFSYFCPFP